MLYFKDFDKRVKILTSHEYYIIKRKRDVTTKGKLLNYGMTLFKEYLKLTFISAIHI